MTLIDPYAKQIKEDVEVKPKHIVICYSGGLDSLLMERFALHYYPDAKITRLFVDHGQESVKAEIDALPEGTVIRKLDWLGDDVSVGAVAKKSDPQAGAIYIPGRNGVIALIAASQFIPDQIWMGTLVDECNKQATDKNDEFLVNINFLITGMMSPFKTWDHRRDPVRFPFVERGWTKTDALREALARKLVTVEEVKATTSCWHNETGLPCGQCKQCFKRALIMNQFQIDEVHAGLHPLHPDNKHTAELISKYTAITEPNADETEVIRLINMFFATRES